MATATVHISTDLHLTGSYEPTGDVLYLSAVGDQEDAALQETPEGHAVRLDASGQVTHITVVNARWLLDRDGELVASLDDGRQLKLGPDGLGDLIAPRAAE